jgi:hypothetical protein
MPARRLRYISIGTAVTTLIDELQTRAVHVGI